ncbi:hypothetical protein ACJJTC_015637 [Scirpophaga incertulas]
MLSQQTYANKAFISKLATKHNPTRGKPPGLTSTPLHITQSKVIRRTEGTESWALPSTPAVPDRSSLAPNSATREANLPRASSRFKRTCDGRHQMQDASEVAMRIISGKLASSGSSGRVLTCILVCLSLLVWRQRGTFM